MSLNYADLKGMLLHTLGATEGTTYSDALLYESVINAFDAILPWVPNQAIADLTSGSGMDMTMPDDCYRIEAVYDLEDGLVLERTHITANKQMPKQSQTTRTGPYNWVEYPKNHINFLQIPYSNVGAGVEGRDFRVFYIAYWDKPTDKDDDTFVLTFPVSALAGVLYWAAAHCLVPGATVSSQIRQFNTRVDSGQPTDNVLEQEIKFLRGMFLDEMNRQPKYIGPSL